MKSINLRLTKVQILSRLLAGFFFLLLPISWVLIPFFYGQHEAVDFYLANRGHFVKKVVTPFKNEANINCSDMPLVIKQDDRYKNEIEWHDLRWGCEMTRPIFYRSVERTGGFELAHSMGNGYRYLLPKKVLETETDDFIEYTYNDFWFNRGLVNFYIAAAKLYKFGFRKTCELGYECIEIQNRWYRDVLNAPDAPRTNEISNKGRDLYLEREKYINYMRKEAKYGEEMLAKIDRLYKEMIPYRDIGNKIGITLFIVQLLTSGFLFYEIFLFLRKRAKAYNITHEK